MNGDNARSNGIGVPARPPVGQRPKRTKKPFGTRRSPLKSSPKRRHISSADYLRLVGAAKAEQGGRCIGHIVGIDHECDDMQFLHLVDQRVIVDKYGEGHEALTDARLGVYGCQWMNGSLDEWRGELRDLVVRNCLRDAAHPEFEIALVEHDLTVEADRKFNGNT